MSAVALGVGAGLAGLAGSILNYSSQNAANAANQRNFELSLAEQRRQFNTSLRYNSEVAQVQRLRQAGLNPALVFGQGGASVAAGSPPSANPIQATDFSGVGTSIHDAMALASSIDVNKSQQDKNLADANLANQDAVGKSIDNLYKDALNQRNINMLDIDYDYKKQLTDLTKLQMKFDTRSFADRLRTIAYQADYQRALRDSVTLSNRYLPQQLKATIGKTIAEEAAAYATGRASLRQAHAAIMNATTAQNAFKTQYGFDEDAQRAYSKAALEFLVQQRKTSQSEEWRNGILNGNTSIGYGIGSSSSSWFINGRDSLGRDNLSPDYTPIIPSGYQHYKDKRKGLKGKN